MGWKSRNLLTLSVCMWWLRGKDRVGERKKKGGIWGKKERDTEEWETYTWDEYRARFLRWGTEPEGERSNNVHNTSNSSCAAILIARWPQDILRTKNSHYFRSTSIHTLVFATQGAWGENIGDMIETSEISFWQMLLPHKTTLCAHLCVHRACVFSLSF